jgi:hypothetical protein
MARESSFLYYVSDISVFFSLIFSSLGASTMIPLRSEQYEAIGRVAVESGTLEREVEEYIARLGHPNCIRGTLGPKLDFLQTLLSSHPNAKSAVAEINSTISMLKQLIEKRNAVVHGVWSALSNAPIIIGEASAKGRKATIHAAKVAALASNLRLARKLLLRHCYENIPITTGPKNPPHRSAAELKKRLRNALAIG